MKDKFVMCCVTRLKISSKHSWYFARTAHEPAWHLLGTSATEPTLIVRDKTKSGAIRRLTEQLALLGFEADFGWFSDIDGVPEVYDLQEPYCLIGRDA